MKVKAVGGVFDHQRNLVQGLQELSMRGCPYEAYSVVGRVGEPGSGGSDTKRGKGLYRALNRLGISGTQAEFYVNRILKGGLLLVLHGVESTQLDQVRSVLQARGARFAQ